MKILVIHQYYLGEQAPGGSRFNEMARLWTEAGHQVTVIAGTIDYTSGRSAARYAGRWITREREGEVSVLRCYTPSTYANSYVGRAWAFFGFSLSSSWAAARCPRPDVIIATSPPLVTALPGFVASRLRWRRVPWIFEIRDLWPESAVTTGVLSATSPVTRLLYLLERWACRSADRVNVLTPAFREDLLKRGLAGSEKIVFVPNGADSDVFSPGPRDNAVRRALGWGNRVVALYAGAHGRANALSQLVATAELLATRGDVLIACVGDGPERKQLEEQVRRKHLTNIAFYGAQPKDRMPDFVNAADIGLAVLQNNVTFRTVYPNKVFDYMACARPVVLAIDGVARSLVCEQARAGVFAEAENPSAIAGALIRLADDPEARAEMGRNGRRWVLDNATRPVLATRYLRIMHELTNGRAAASNTVEAE